MNSELPTPRTDNAILCYANGVPAHFPAGCLTVNVDFARTLERELSADQRENAELREQLAEANIELHGEREHVRIYVSRLTPEIWKEYHEKGSTHGGWRCLVYNGISIVIARAEAAEVAVTKLREALKYARADFDDCIIGVDCEMPVTRESFQQSIQRIDAALTQTTP